MDGMYNWPIEAIQYIQKLEQEIKELKERITKLENKLQAYENPHTPPSQQRFKRNSGGNNINPPGKRGAPVGHHGATRVMPKPDEIIPVTIDQCPCCGSVLGDAVSVEQRTIEEIPPPKKTRVTRYILHKYVCPACGSEVTARHPDCPMVGDLGVRLMTNITMAKFHQRGVLRRIQETLCEQYVFQISPKGIHDVLLRVGHACAGEYEQLIQRIRLAQWRYTDETGIQVMGKNWWLWIFRSNTDDILAVIRPSRGQDVLKEIHGEQVNGADVTDGWRSYHCLPVTQRCWAHLLREVDAYKDASEHGRQLSEKMHKRFRLLKEFIRKNPPMEERKQMKEIWDAELQALVDEYIEYLDVRAMVKYIKNGIGCWYTCLLYPGMQPTNNLAEQAIREHVIVRKIIGTFRSIKGSENYQYIASLFATWKFQGKNITVELENLLRRELCLSPS